MSLFFFVAGVFARMLYQRGGSRGFWVNRIKRILLPLVVGWVVVFPAIGVVWLWGLTKTFGGTMPSAPANLPPPPPAAFPLTHLWFLYYLLVLYAVVVSCRAIVVALDRNGSVRRFADTCVRGARPVRRGCRRLAAPADSRAVFPRSVVLLFRNPDAGSVVHSATGVTHRLWDRGRIRVARASADRVVPGVEPAVGLSPCRRGRRNRRVLVDSRSDSVVGAGGAGGAEAGLRVLLRHRDLVLVVALLGLATRFLSRPARPFGTSPTRPTGFTSCTCRSSSRCRWRSAIFPGIGASSFRSSSPRAWRCCSAVTDTWCARRSSASC